MKVIIARHAKTNENAGEIIIGQESEVLLNEEGVLQANKLADFLRKETNIKKLILKSIRSMKVLK